MRLCRALCLSLTGLLVWARVHGGQLPKGNGGGTNAVAFLARGVVRELKADGKTIVIEHEAISNYMAAMTMPFKVKDSKELADIRFGDQVSFRLQVTETESWIDRISPTRSLGTP